MDDLSCEICMEIFNETDRRPKSLNCGHTMCLACIQRLKSCSWDNMVVEHPEELKDNYYLLRMIDNSQRMARFWCLECSAVARNVCLDDHPLLSLKMFRAKEVREQTQCLEKAVSLHSHIIDKLLSISNEFSATIRRLVDDVSQEQSELQDSLNRLQDIMENGGSEEAWMAARERCEEVTARARQALPSMTQEAKLLEHKGMLSLKLRDRCQQGKVLGAFLSLAAEVENDTKDILLLAMLLLNRAGKLRTMVTPPASRGEAHRQQEHSVADSHEKGENDNVKPSIARPKDEDTDGSDSESEVVEACAHEESLARIQKEKEAEERQARYELMVTLDSQEVVPHLVDRFECPVCMVVCDPGSGVMLRECLHSFCRNCIADAVQFSSEAEVKCPYADNEYVCPAVMQEREIRALVTPEIFEQYLKRSVSQAESLIQNTFHCRTPDCPGWCEFEFGVNFFICPVCMAENCLACQVLHPEENCAEYQARIKAEAQTNEDAKKTQEQLEQMLKDKTAMKCPSCGVVIMKRAGCDGMVCAMCKTQICWATRGPRWGPRGSGDTSGGCRCGVNGRKCHPQCGNCH